MCFIAAKLAGWTLTYKGIYPIVQVGFGPVKGDDLKRFQNCNNQIADLLDEAKTRCKAALVEQGKADEWTAEELDSTAQALGYGAVKYENLKSDRFTTYTFSFDQMLDDKGNTAIYLQYTHARICSIIRKSGKEIEELKKAGELVLKSDEERELGLHLLRFTEVVGKVCLVHLPDMLCEYIYDLFKKFNCLYSSVCKDMRIAGLDEDKSIGGSVKETNAMGSDEDTSNLLLCEATAVVMRKCFHLLGITPICKI